MTRLSYPAPWADSEKGPEGWWHKPWTLDAMLDYELAGGWFKRSPTGLLDPRYRIEGRSQNKTVKPGHERCRCELSK